jgi:hypothetical protein
MNIKVKELFFEDIFTQKFLFYSWLDLKFNQNLFSSVYQFKNLEPLKTIWFKRASNLIRRSQFVYRKTTNINSLTFIKNKIVENSLLIFIYTSLKINTANIHSYVTECVRELIQLIYIFFLLNKNL